MAMNNLGYGPLSHLLTYLNAKELSSASGTSSWMLSNTSLAWNELDQMVQLGNSEAETAIERACRFYKAQLYAETWMRMAFHHFDFDDPERCHLKCHDASSSSGSSNSNTTSTSSSTCGCHPQQFIFPNLNTNVFHQPEQYEYFVRLCYRKKPEKASSDLIWEGFVGATREKPNVLLFHMQSIFTAMHWPCMKSFLSLIGEDDPIASEQPDDLAILYEAMDNLAVTVIALEKQLPYYRASLVVATGGFHDGFSISNDEPVDGVGSFRLHPRNVQSHSVQRNADWINVEIMTYSCAPGQTAEFLGLLVSYQEG